MKYRQWIRGAAVGAVLVVAAPGASRASVTMTAACSPGTAGSFSDCTVWRDAGSAAPSSAVYHFPTGWAFAAANSATSPITPVPNAGDRVGSVDAYRDVLADGCGNPAHSTSTLTWVQPDGSGPPGTVAQLSARGTVVAGVFTTATYYVVARSGGGYDLQVNDPPNLPYCTGGPNQYGLTLDGVVPGTARVFMRLPTTPGTYTISVTSDSGSDSASLTIS